MIGVNGLFDHGAAVARLFKRSNSALQLWDYAIGKFAGAGEISAALRLLQFSASCVQLFLNLLCVAEFVFFRLPALRHGVRAFFQIGDFSFENAETIL